MFIQSAGKWDVVRAAAGRGVLKTGIAAAVLALSVGNLYAAPEAPSNAELYRMIQELQAEQGRLRDETRKAKAEAAEAKRELAESKRELAAVRQEQRRQPVAGGVSEAHDPGVFVRVENTFMTFGQEGGVTDILGNSADFDHEYAPRIELGYVGSGGMGIRGRYWLYDHDAGSVGSDKVSVDTDYLDLELFQRWQLSANTELEGAVGVRYLDYKQEATNVAATQVADIDFDGWGGTTALQLKRRLGNYGGLYGRGRYSLLWGDSEITVTTAGVPVSFDADDNPVHQVELALGYELEHKFAWGGLNANLGYEWQYWTNLAPGDTTFGGIGNDDVLEDVSFRGWVLGVGVDF
jgi:hypothetical protein